MASCVKWMDTVVFGFFNFKTMRSLDLPSLCYHSYQPIHLNQSPVSSGVFFLCFRFSQPLPFCICSLQSHHMHIITLLNSTMVFAVSKNSRARSTSLNSIGFSAAVPSEGKMCGMDPWVALRALVSLHVVRGCKALCFSYDMAILSVVA